MVLILLFRPCDFNGPGPAAGMKSAIRPALVWNWTTFPGCAPYKPTHGWILISVIMNIVSSIHLVHESAAINQCASMELLAVWKPCFLRHHDGREVPGNSVDK